MRASHSVDSLNDLLDLGGRRGSEGLLSDSDVSEFCLSDHDKITKRGWATMLEDVVVETGDAISPKKHCADGVMMDESTRAEPKNSDQVIQNKSVDALLKCAYLQDNVSDDMTRTHDITNINGISNNSLHDYFSGQQGSMTAGVHYSQGLSGMVDGGASFDIRKSAPAVAWGGTSGGVAGFQREHNNNMGGVGQWSNSILTGDSKHCNIGARGEKFMVGDSMTDMVIENQQTWDGGLTNVAANNNKKITWGGAPSVRQEHEGNYVSGRQHQQWVGEIVNNSYSEGGLPSRGSGYVRTEGGDFVGRPDNIKMRAMPMSMWAGNEVSGSHFDQDVSVKSHRYTGGFDSQHHHRAKYTQHRQEVGGKHHGMAYLESGMGRDDNLAKERDRVVQEILYLDLPMASTCKPSDFMFSDDWRVLYLVSPLEASSKMKNPYVTIRPQEESLLSGLKYIVQHKCKVDIAVPHNDRITFGDEMFLVALHVALEYLKDQKYDCALSNWSSCAEKISSVFQYFRFMNAE